MPNTPANMMASDTIYPSRFVSVSEDFKIAGTTTGAGTPILGVSQSGTNFPPLSDIVDPAGTSPQPAAIAGQALQIYGDGDVCLLEAGGGISAGDRLTADGAGTDEGRAITTTTDQDEIGALALQGAAAAGELILVNVIALRTLSAA